jgi:hypothetical protein
MFNPNQPPPLTKEELETFLTTTGYATLCTHNKDGSIHAAPVGYMYSSGKIDIISHTSTRKNRNIRRNNQVTLLVDTKKPFRGALVYGEASISRENVLPMVMKMFESMTPAEKVEVVSREYLNVVDCVIISVFPKRVVSFDFEKYDVWRKISDKYDLKWDWF